MLELRQVEIAPDGSTFGDRVVIVFEGQAGRKITFNCDPDGLYDEVRSIMAKFSQVAPAEDPVDMSPEMNALKKRISGLIKVAVKGILLAYGDSILTLAFRTKDHPRPHKGDDLIEWYTNMFARMGIGYLMKKDTVLTGKTVQEDEHETLITVDHVSTRPIPTPARAE